MEWGWVPLWVVLVFILVELNSVNKTLKLTHQRIEWIHEDMIEK